jgi:hypothetical protein
MAFSQRKYIVVFTWGGASLAPGYGELGRWPRIVVTGGRMEGGRPCERTTTRMASVTGRIISCGAGKNEMANLATLTKGVRIYLTQRRYENISVGHKKMQ